MKETVARNVFVIYKVDPIFAFLPESAALPSQLLPAPALNKSIQITLEFLRQVLNIYFFGLCIALCYFSI